MRLRLTTLLVLCAGLAHAQAEDEGGMIAERDGQRIELPLLRSAYEVEITGGMAAVEVVQVFENPADAPVNAEYLFPLSRHAAVHAMEMHVGDEVVRAVIQEKAEAEETFGEAQEAGQAAALLTQHRPNMFTQKVANLMPGLPVEVRLSYVQSVPKVDGDYELVVPLIVGPRYVGAPSAPLPVALRPGDDAAPAAPVGQWGVAPVPDYPRAVAGLDLPADAVAPRVSLAVSLDAGVPVQSFGSPTHALAVERGATGATARLAGGAVLDDRDLILRYGLEGEAVAAAALSHADERGGFVSVLIEPPAAPAEADIAPREMVFVLDSSGSMSGAPMAASKRFMMAALEGLRPQDYVRVIPFDTSARQMSEAALRATPANLMAAERYVRGLRAGGGTEIDRAIRTAFDAPRPAGALRIVVFLSDGYIGDEATVLRTIRRRIGGARIYAFGVGSSVNRYLLDGMAEEGRGYARYVGLDEDALEVAETFARDLGSPVLTDIEIDWGGLGVTDVTPAAIPDLFAGGSVRVHARRVGAEADEITVEGRVMGRPAAMRIDVPAAGEAPALPLVWARRRVAELERAAVMGDRSADAAITRLGLDFSLQTKNTSFVAVSERRVNEGARASEAEVPLPMVHGVGPAAYPQGFSGSSTPEPQAWLGMLVVAALTLVRARRARRAAA